MGTSQARSVTDCAPDDATVVREVFGLAPLQPLLHDRSPTSKPRPAAPASCVLLEPGGMPHEDLRCVEKDRGFWVMVRRSFAHSK
jgi:hypothetical protein